MLKDDLGILIQQTKNVQAARQVRLTDVHQITRQQRILKTYIAQAIKVEKAGLKVPFKEAFEFEIPVEFAAKLKAQAALEKAFVALTPGRQRGCLLHFGSAKQSATREARIEKHMQRILAGKGLDD